MKLRGDGRCCLRDRTWWVQFYVDGKQQRESAKTTDQETGEKYLRRRLKEVHAHELDPSTPFVSRHDKRRTIAELLDALKVDYEIREKDSPMNLSGIARARAAHLPPRPREISGKPGPEPARKLASGACFTIFAAPPVATWSTPAYPKASR
jgi:hypothetical protein